MTDEESPDTHSRRRRLATRRRRTRIVGAIVAIALIALGVGAALAVRSNDEGSATPADRHPRTVNKHPAPDSSVATASNRPPRKISHDNPLRLWIGGDSLSGSFGPALGQTGGATGVVDARIDYKVSSGLADHGIRDWPEHAQQEMADENPDHVVFIIGANDVSIVNSSDSNGDGVHDWEVDYRKKIDEMMQIFVGGERHRIVYWLGPPTMGDHTLNKGAYELGRVMRSEAAKFKPDVVYIDTYRIFADENGDYSRYLPDAHGDSRQMRISDGVHFSVDGAKYLADKLWTRLDKRWHITGQADPSQPIDYTIAEGSNDYVPGIGDHYSSDDNWDDGGSDDPPATAPSATTPPSTPATAPPTTGKPPPPTTPPTTKTTSPPPTVPPVTVPTT
jgi:hypothetical protein